MKNTFKLASLVVAWTVLLWATWLVSHVSAEETTTTAACSTVSCNLWTKKDKQEKFYLSDEVIKIIDKFVDKVDTKAKDAFWSLTSDNAKKYVMWIYWVVVEKFYEWSATLEKTPALANNEKAKTLAWIMKDIALLFNVKWHVLNWTYVWDHYYYNQKYNWDEKNNYNPNAIKTEVKEEPKKEEPKKEDDSHKSSVVFKDAIRKLAEDIKKVTDSNEQVDKTMYEPYNKNLKWEKLYWYEIVWNHVLQIANESWKKIVNSWESTYDFSKLLTAWKNELNFITLFWANRKIDVVNSDYALLKNDSVQWKDQSNQDTQTTTALKVLNNFDKWFFRSWEWYLWFAPFNSKADAKAFMENQNIASLWYIVQIWSTSKYALFFNPFEV